MTIITFTAALRSELHFRGQPFDGAGLEAFAASVFPLVDDDGLVDVGRWADEFLEHQAGMIVGAWRTG
jgi:hypothetical protein